jgi:1,4-dihydroxy-2-naphthoate polyprenyltransferase
VNAPATPLKRWVAASRPRTLPSAAVPVAIGVAAFRPNSINWLNALLCLFVALALQIGTNYANDYSDGVRGTDENRVGPFRLTASKMVSAKKVRNAAFLSFALAGVAGVVLASRSSWWMVVVGLTAVAAGWFYTGGPKPYGYYGFGEIFVLIYFGIVAVVGTMFAQSSSTAGQSALAHQSWPLGYAAGMLACVMLEANNLRDIDGDQASGKKTLAARLGRARAGWLYWFCVSQALLGFLVSRHLLVCAVIVVAYWPALKLARSSKNGRELLPLLKFSARAQLQVGVVAVAVLALHYGVL